MSRRIVPYCTLLLIVFTSTLLAWAPFLFSGTFQTVYKHFDGPLYIVPAKTGYDAKAIEKIARDPAMPKDPKYYAAHLPGYPFAIWLAAQTRIGYLKSMLAVTVLSTVFFAWGLYFVLSQLKLVKNPLAVTTVLLFLPRFLVVRTIGSPEPLFITFIVCSLYCFEKKHYFWAGVAGAAATAIKLPGILLFPAYALALLESRSWKWNQLWLFLIPASLAGVFGLYQVRFQDFFAYFHTGGTVPLVYPFAVFNAAAKWVGTAWLEDVWFYFVLYAATAAVLWNSKYRSFFYFTAVFLAGTLFVQHRDIARYALPIVPMAGIAFGNHITDKKYLPVVIIALAGAYAYAWNFIGANTMPITEWLPFL